jgi:hypothetical protein
MPMIWLQRIFIFGMEMVLENSWTPGDLCNVRLVTLVQFMGSSGGTLGPNMSTCISTTPAKGSINWLNVLIKSKTIRKIDELLCLRGIHRISMRWRYRHAICSVNFMYVRQFRLCLSVTAHSYTFLVVYEM